MALTLPCFLQGGQHVSEEGALASLMRASVPMHAKTTMLAEHQIATPDAPAVQGDGGASL